MFWAQVVMLCIIIVGLICNFLVSVGHPDDKKRLSSLANLFIVLIASAGWYLAGGLDKIFPSFWDDSTNCVERVTE